MHENIRELGYNYDGVRHTTSQSNLAVQRAFQVKGSNRCIIQGLHHLEIQDSLCLSPSPCYLPPGVAQQHIHIISKDYR